MPDDKVFDPDDIDPREWEPIDKAKTRVVLSITLRDNDEDADVFAMSCQELIDTGLAWTLEGHIGRQCAEAIEQGYAVLGPEGHRGFWGQWVPGRDQVTPGSKGTLEYANRLREQRGEEPLAI